MKTERDAGRATRAFTLIEIVVVIAIIAILATLALLVGQRVTQTARINLTRDLLRTLDKTQDNYTADKGGDGSVPFKWTNPLSTTAVKDEFAIADAMIMPGSNLDRVEPSLTFYLLATKEAPSVQATIGQVDSRFVISSPISHATPAAGTAFNNYTTIYTRSGADPQLGSPANQPLRGLVIKDPWGNAIRYVHPKFQGGYGDYATINAGTWAAATGRPTVFVGMSEGGTTVNREFRRSFHPYVPAGANAIADADEGLCVGGRGYFYSCGPDGDPGTREDNVYTVPPQFPKETAKSSAAQ